MKKIISTYKELISLDHEVPGIPEFTVSDANMESIVIKAFEEYNNVVLDTEALIEFKSYIDDVFGVNP